MDASFGEQRALTQVGCWLAQSGYRFVTPTPLTHTRLQRRREGALARSLRDIFGWSMPFHPSLLPVPVVRWLEQGNAVEQSAGHLHSKVRYSTLDGSLYVHSAYPTTVSASVFFGPDTYRFAALIKRTLAPLSPGRLTHVVDIGCGTGAGGIVAAKKLGGSSTRCILSDINPAALEFARVNCELAGVRDASLREGSLFEAVPEPIDVLLANPPYLVDPQARLYRHGGGALGTELSTRIVVEGLPRLTENGILILYTGSPVIEGLDTFWKSVEPVLREGSFEYDYCELDPDVFGEELEQPAYAEVERIAVVALVVRRAGQALHARASRDRAADPAFSRL